MPIPATPRKTKLRKNNSRLVASVRETAPKRLKSASGPSSAETSFHLPLSTTRIELLDRGGDTDHRFRQLLFDFSTLGASIEVARAHLASVLGLSSPQYNIAMVLANHQNVGGISVSEVARHLHVSTAFITCEAGKLEQSGFVEKLPNPSDGRGVLLRLSARGAALVQRIGTERQVVNDHLFASLTARDFQELSKTLSALIDDFSHTLSLLKLGCADPSTAPPRSGTEQ
jgi:DNA-binding MarR family transcriptional regulator